MSSKLDGLFQILIDAFRVDVTQFQSELIRRSSETPEGQRLRDWARENPVAFGAFVRILSVLIKRISRATRPAEGLKELLLDQLEYFPVELQRILVSEPRTRQHRAPEFDSTITSDLFALGLNFDRDLYAMIEANAPCFAYQLMLSKELGEDVVGALRSSCHFAACLCDRFAFLVPLESHVPYVLRTVQTYGMESFVSDIKAVNVYESDMSKQHGVILQRAVNLSKEMVDRGAQAIIPLGGLLFPYEVDPKELENEIGVPVINTKAVSIRFAELMVIGKMMHSPKAYPWSPGLSPDDVSRRIK